MLEMLASKLGLIGPVAILAAGIYGYGALNQDVHNIQFYQAQQFTTIQQQLQTLQSEITYLKK